MRKMIFQMFTVSLLFKSPLGDDGVAVGFYL